MRELSHLLKPSPVIGLFWNTLSAFTRREEVVEYNSRFLKQGFEPSTFTREITLNMTIYDWNHQLYYVQNSFTRIITLSLFSHLSFSQVVSIMERAHTTEPDRVTENIDLIYDESEHQWVYLEMGSHPSDGKYITVKSPVPLKP